MRFRLSYLVGLCWLAALVSWAEAEQGTGSDAAHSPLQGDNNDIELTDEEKRTWASLHGGGGWGKRGWQDLNSAWGKRGWQDLNSAWGKRAWQDLNSAWGKRGWQDLNSAWGKRAWQDLNSAWGKRGWQDLNSAWGKRGYGDLDSEDKRAWNDMNGAWGKREKWSNLRGAWGKRSETPGEDYEDVQALDKLSLLQPQASQGQLREPESVNKRAWSSLHGAWGKRPSKQLKFQGVLDPSGSFYWKREPSWTNLRGMWGKRAAAPQGDIEGRTPDEA